MNPSLNPDTASFTPDELEKAAAVRIFQKVASAENIDLSTLSDEQVEELFEHFQVGVLPEIVGAATAGDTAEAKIASLNDEELFMLFDKQASAEELDLSGASEEQLVEAFGYFLENVLPAMAENGFEPVGVEKSAEVEEAQAKLAEADVLGRAMARGYVDELDKLAGVGDAAKALLGRGAAAVRQGGQAAYNTAQVGGHLLSGKKLQGAGAAALGGGAALAGAAGAGLGIKKLVGGEKKASVVFSAEDVETLGQLAESGDLASLQKAASLIKSAAMDDMGNHYTPRNPGKIVDDMGNASRTGLKGKIRDMGAAAFGAAKRNPGKATAGAAAGAATLVGAAALARRKASEKNASAFDALVDQRAAELANGWLAENGYGAA